MISSVILLLTSCLVLLPAAEDQAAQEIRHLIEQQQRDWNRGDIVAFMQGYDKSESLIFTSGGNVHRGWNNALKRYQEQYPDRHAMGQLEFTGLEITVLGVSAAVVLGKWSLTRKQDHPHGIFTLVVRKGSEGWKIIHDHTSAASTAQGGRP